MPSIDLNMEIDLPSHARVVVVGGGVKFSRHGM